MGRQNSEMSPLLQRETSSTHREAAPHEALESLIRLIEYELPEMRGSILLLDEDGTTLHHGAAPSLDPEYCRLIDGAQIGPAAGSCGTAAWRKQQVIVRDIATDPLWDGYRELALPFGLRACWSTPIFDHRREVLGTFAMYYDDPRTPAEREQGLAATATLLACSIILRARAEEALRRSEAQMREARAEAEQANREKAAFLAMMSHELRTPLNAIGGYAELMLSGIPTPPAEAHRDYLQRIVKGQQHLLGLIDAVLTQAKLESGRMTYNLETIRLGEILETVESLSMPQIAANGIAYSREGCDLGLALRGDREKTVQILLNLISNAVKFTPAGGSVTIRAASVSGRVVIGVRDTGRGMTPEQVASVFEPYVQFDDSLTRGHRGIGLGMPISRELARGMGGDLTLTSEPGVGTEFFLTLSTDLGSM